MPRSRKLPAHREALGHINQPDYQKMHAGKQHYERVALVFQGGGALGSYQVGAYEALHENGYEPNYFAGVSIGAINCAIIAGNRPHQRIKKLREFWDLITPKLWTDLLINYDTNDFSHHLHNQTGALYSVFHGIDGFFKPRPIMPGLFRRDTPDKLSFYDTSELYDTLKKVINFDLINEQKSTLCIGAVNVVTGEMLFFNNQKMKITPKHIMASAALPPGLPAVKIGDDYYWDGGIYANTPLITVLDALPELNTLCFVVDCFKLHGRLPQSMDEMEERQKDIRYASHSRRLTNVYASRQNLQSAIHFLGEKLPEKLKKDPEIQKILALGHKKRFSVVHVIYNGTPYAHFYKDYNFVRSTVIYRMKQGYKNTISILKNPVWEKPTETTMDCSIFGVPNDYFDQH